MDDIMIENRMMELIDTRKYNEFLLLLEKCKDNRFFDGFCDRYTRSLLMAGKYLTELEKDLAAGSIYSDALIEEFESKYSDSRLLHLQDYFKHVYDRAVRLGYNKESMELHNEEKQYLEAVCNVIQRYHSYFSDLADKYYYEYSDKYTRLKNGIYSHFFLLISVGGLDWFSRRYGIISSSIITENHTKLYNGNLPRCGWIFKPTAAEILSMSPGDSNSYAEKVSNKRISDSLRDLVMKYFSGGMPAFDDYWYTLTDFEGAPFLPLNEMGLGQIDSFNEVVLKGDTKPKGVFVNIGEGLYYKTACVIAKALNLPLVRLLSNRSGIEITEPVFINV